MKHHYLKRLKWKMMFRYVLIVGLFIFLGLAIVYLFDTVLNGLIIDFLQLFYLDPFESFKRFFKILLPFIVAIFCFILIYFLCKDLTLSMRTLMNGMDDVIRKGRSKVTFSKDMIKAEQALMQVVEEYQTYQLSAQLDEEKKKDLIYLLAQDIRMPLTKILMFLDFLEREHRISPELKKDYIIQILNESLLLEDMMNEFFDITRFNLQYAKWVPETIFLDRMMEQVVDECYYLAEEKAMELHLVHDSQLVLYADNAKVARVFRDLLTTLITLGNEHCTIEVSLRERKQEYIIHLYVQSVHYSADQLAHMFHNFYRLEDMSGNGKGHVMGLGIAKQIVDMMQGSIRGESIADRLGFIINIAKDHI